MRFSIDDLESPLLVIILGVALAVMAISLGTESKTVDAILDISQALITGGLGGIAFKPLRNY